MILQVGLDSQDFLQKKKPLDSQALVVAVVVFGRFCVCVCADYPCISLYDISMFSALYIWCIFILIHLHVWLIKAYLYIYYICRKLYIPYGVHSPNTIQMYHQTTYLTWFQWFRKGKRRASWIFIVYPDILCIWNIHIILICLYNVISMYQKYVYIKYISLYIHYIHAHMYHKNPSNVPQIISHMSKTYINLVIKLWDRDLADAPWVDDYLVLIHWCDRHGANEFSDVTWWPPTWLLKPSHGKNQPKSSRRGWACGFDAVLGGSSQLVSGS